MNGEEHVSFPASLSGFKVTSKRDNDKQVTYQHVELGHGHENLVIRILKDFVTVTLKRGTSTDFNGARGLMGSFPLGEKMGRDGHTVMDDAETFGQEWQVLRGEPHLFQTIVSPQHPQRCTPPPKRSTHHRRLGEQEVVDREEAEQACAREEFPTKISNSASLTSWPPATPTWRRRTLTKFILIHNMSDLKALQSSIS